MELRPGYRVIQWFNELQNDNNIVLRNLFNAFNRFIQKNYYRKMHLFLFFLICYSISLKVCPKSLFIYNITLHLFIYETTATPSYYGGIKTKLTISTKYYTYRRQYVIKIFLNSWFSFFKLWFFKSFKFFFNKHFHLSNFSYWWFFFLNFQIFSIFSKI